MSAAAVPPGLPGTSASGAVKVSAILYGALLLMVAVSLALLDVTWSWSGARGGHLPWPVLQWVLTTPLGTLLLTALCLLVVAPSYLLLNRWPLRMQLARAVDITGLPPALWSSPWPTYPQPPALSRWLGYGRRERALSLALLVLGALLAVVLIGVFFGSTVYGLRASDARIAPDGNGCLNGCPPTYPLTGIVIASLFAAIAFSTMTQYRWLRHVEASSHVWLRYRSWLIAAPAAPLYYVRPPEAPPEAAAAALARFSSTRLVPLARMCCIFVLAMTPYVLLVSASFVLSGWLQLQWIPG
ncbi:MAG TPA: hypothetical protein VF040_11575 [Ktedonobacterales bacterium]